MKKLLLAVLMLTATFSIIGVSAESVYAKSGGSTNSIPASQVPKVVKRNFKSMYPTATQIEWEYKPVYYGTPVYTASFHLGSQKWEANFYADGSFLSAYPKI